MVKFQKPEKPILSPYFIFIEEEKWKAVKETPNLSISQIAKNAYLKWLNFEYNNREELQKYENISKQIKNEADAQVYLKQLEEQYKPIIKHKPKSNIKKKTKQIKQKLKKQ